jgi:hypothetical protein
MTRVVNRIKGLLDVHGVVVPIMRGLPCSGSALFPPASPFRAHVWRCLSSPRPRGGGLEGADRQGRSWSTRE